MNNPDNKSFFPILLDLRQFPILVVGGGQIAYRKVTSLLEYNSSITVIAPELCSGLKELANKGKITIRPKSYEQGDASGYGLVFAAVGKQEVNEIISEDCHREKILLNVADVPFLCDFIMPAIINRGPLTVAVGSQGSAPFYTKSIKEHISRILSPLTADVARLAAIFRTKLLESGKYDSAEQREILIRHFLEINWEEIIYQKGNEDAKRMVEEIVE